jgi:hypothetical protein
MRFYKTSNRSAVLDRLDQQQRTAAPDDALLEQFLTPARPPIPLALTSVDAPQVHADPLSPKPAAPSNPNLSPFEKELLQAWSQD